MHRDIRCSQHAANVGERTRSVVEAKADIERLHEIWLPAGKSRSGRGVAKAHVVGAGTRVKVADGFSRKCPIVSTHLGAFGYDVRSGRELLLADKPDDFATACVSLIRDPTGASAMADRAYAAFLQNWTWDAIAPRVWAAAEDALRLGSRLAAQPA